MPPHIRTICRNTIPGTVGLVLLIALVTQSSCRHAGHVVQEHSGTDPLPTDSRDTPNPLLKDESFADSILLTSQNELAPTMGNEIDLAGGVPDNDWLTVSSDANNREGLSDRSEQLSLAQLSENAVEETIVPSIIDSSADRIELTTTDELTLEDLVAMSLSHNPAIHQAAATAQKAQGVRRQIGLYPNPTIGYMGEEMGDNGTAGMQGAFVSQMIVLGDKLCWNRRVADQEVQSQLWQVESQRYRVQNDVRRQFYLTLGAQQRLLLAQELVRIATDGVDNATILKKANQAALPDVLQAKIQLQEVDIIQRNTEYEYNASWDVLAALVGLPGLNPVPLKDVLEAEQPARDRETAWAQIIAISPQLRQAYADVSRARTQIQREKVQPIPNIQVDVGVMHMNVSNDNAASVLLGIPVPLFNANEGNIDRAAAEYHRATWNAQRLEMSLKAQLARAFSEYLQALNRAETYRDQILPAETETLELIEAAYPLQFDFLRLLTARRSYFEARIEYLTALVNLRTSEVALDGLLLSGGLNDVPDTTFDDNLRSRAFNGR